MKRRWLSLASCWSSRQRWPLATCRRAARGEARRRRAPGRARRRHAQLRQRRHRGRGEGGERDHRQEFRARSAREGHGQHRLGAAGVRARWCTTCSSRRCACRATPRSRTAASSRSFPRPMPSCTRARRAARRTGRAPAATRSRRRSSRCKYESAAQLVPILRPLISPNNTIAAYPGNNTLVITDYADNLQRIEKIIDSIDQPSGTEPVVIPLRTPRRSTSRMTVNRLFAEAPQAAGARRRTPTQRLTRGRRRALEQPDRALGQPVAPRPAAQPRRDARFARPAPAGNIHVVYLKNAEAVKLAETLRAIYLRETPRRAARRAARPAGAAAASAGHHAGASRRLRPRRSAGSRRRRRRRPRRRA